MGSLENTPAARAEAWVNSLKIYVASASRHATKQKAIADVNKLIFDKELNSKYPVDVEQAKVDWAKAMGEPYGMAYYIDKWIFDFPMRLVGSSIKDLEGVNRFFAHLGTSQRVLTWNLGNLVAQHLQPMLGFSQLTVEGAHSIMPVIRGFKDYHGLKTNKELHPFVEEMHKRGVISLSLAKELQDSSLKERRSSGEINPEIFKKTPGEKFKAGAKEILLQTETERVEIQTRLQMALIGRQAFKDLKGKDGKLLYTGDTLNGMIEQFVNDTMHSYEEYGKAPLFTNGGFPGHLASPLSTFATGEMNRLFDLARGSIKGSNKWNNQKALTQYMLTWIMVGGGASLLPIKIIDGYIEAYNSIFADKPIPTLSSRIIGDDDIPEALKIGMVSSALGVSLQNTLAQPTNMGGVGTAGFFGVNYGIALMNAGVSAGKDLIAMGDLADDTLIKMEKVASPALAGMLDAWRSYNKNNMSTNTKDEARYKRTDYDTMVRLLGMRSNAEALQINIDLKTTIGERMIEAAKTEMKVSMVHDFYYYEKLDDEKLLSFVMIGGTVEEVMESVLLKKKNRMFTPRQRMLMNGLTAVEVTKLKETDELYPEEKELGVSDAFETE